MYKPIYKPIKAPTIEQLAEYLEVIGWKLTSHRPMCRWIVNHKNEDTGFIVSDNAIQHTSDAMTTIRFALKDVTLTFLEEKGTITTLAIGGTRSEGIFILCHNFDKKT